MDSQTQFKGASSIYSVALRNFDLDELIAWRESILARIGQAIYLHLLCYAIQHEEKTYNHTIFGLPNDEGKGQINFFNRKIEDIKTNFKEREDYLIRHFQEGFPTVLLNSMKDNQGDFISEDQWFPHKEARLKVASYLKKKYPHSIYKDDFEVCWLVALFDTKDHHLEVMRPELKNRFQL